MRHMLFSAVHNSFKLPRFAAVAAILCVGMLALPGVEGAEDAELNEMFDSFFKVELDTSRSANMAGMKIERDGLELEFSSGRMWFAQPLNGRITGGHFVGEGVVTITANGLAGINMLKATLSGKNSGVKFPGKLPADMILRPVSGEKDFDVFKAKFTEVFVRFDDGLEEEVAGLMEEGGGDASQAQASFAQRNDKGFYADNAHLERDFILQTLGGIDRFPFFMAEFLIGPEWLTYAENHSAPQEIWVGTHPSIGAGVNQRIFTWTSYDLSQDYSDKGHWDGDLLLDQKSILDVSKVKMDINLPTTASLEIDAHVTFTPLAEELSLVSFDLINNYGYGWWEKGGRPVTLKSVQDADGNELPFIHKRNTVLVRLPQPLAPGSEATLRFVADEKTIIQITDYSWNVVNTYPWFPQHGYVGGKYAIDWTIRVKSPLTAIASGNLVETREEQGMQITRWVMEEEVAFPSFIFGRFSSREDKYKSDKTGREIIVGVHAQPLGDLRGTSKMKSVSKEAQNILTLFEEFFGPYPYDRIDITQMAPGLGFGQAPPGLLFLTGEAFIPTGLLAAYSRGGRAPYFHDFFAHEMAHQWYGHKVLWGRDEDQWLSEAFAEYASAIYAEQIDGSDKFQQKLTDWRDGAAIGERSGFPVAAGNLSSAPDAGISGSYRTGLIYQKGAYVVHMMRTLMGPDKFLASMKQFLDTHDGNMATTQMLKADVEQVLGVEMDWFFDQWFYTAGTPVLHFSHETQRSEDGQIVLSGRIVQDEDNWKQMVIPVYYDLGGKEPSVQRVAVASADFVFKAKLPVEPNRVWLDEQRSVLATMGSDKAK